LNLQNATQQRRPEYVPDPHRYVTDFDGSAHRAARRRLNWFNWFAGLTLLAAAVAAIMEAL